MSLEQAITDHAGALRELAAAIRATIGATHDTTAAAAETVISNAKNTAASKPQATVVTKPAAEVKAAAAAALVTEAAPTYDDVKAKVLALSKDKGREPTVQLLERHGVAKAPDLKPEQYAAFIADVDAIMAGTYDPEAAEIA